MEKQDKRLYRSRANRVIGGVCGGLGEYFGFDPTILRIVLVILIFFKGVGLLAYLIAWLCMPKQRDDAGYQQGFGDGFQQGRQQDGPYSGPQ